MTESLRCTACGSALPPGARFCAQCAAPVAAAPAPRPAGERRQATILFADISGYTRLSSQIDPEELHELLQRYFAAADAAVRHYGGRVDKHIGDAVMGVFGAPRAHDNDPERAVRAAIDIHAAMERLSTELGREFRVHIGIASGEVVAAESGSDVHREYTVLGDAVNLASRLDGLAKGGETVVSAPVRLAVARLFDAEDAGEVDVRGLDEPVRAYRIRGLARETAPPLRPLVGRRTELERLEAMLDEVSRDRAGRAVLVRGEPGIGKSRLLEEVRQRAQRGAFRCHSGLVLDFGVRRGEDAIGLLAHGLVGVSAHAPHEARVTAAKQVAGELAFDQATTAALFDLLALPPPQADLWHAMTDAGRRDAGDRALGRLVERVASLSPLLLSVEDLHWADASTGARLRAIAKVVAGLPVVLLLSSRPEGDWAGELAEPARALVHDVVDLAPLGPEDAQQMAAELVGDDAPAIARCLARAAGNPLFLEQLLRNASEAASDQIPDSVQSLAQARADRLPAADRAALQAASVLGQRFALEPLRFLLEDVGYECRELIRHQLVRPLGDELLFGHALIREGIYNSLLRPVRRALHARAAVWFETRDPELHAEHLDRADAPGTPAAYFAAATVARAEHRSARAVDLARRGGELASSSAERYRLAILEGESARDYADAPAALAAYARALESAETDLDRCRALIGTAEGFRIKAGLADAADVLDRAEALATSLGRDVELANVLLMRGSAAFFRAQGAECLDFGERAYAHALRGGDVELQARALSTIADAHFCSGRMRSSHEYFLRCVDLCRAHGLLRIEVAQYSQIGSTALFLHDVAGAITWMHRGVEAARRSGNRRAEFFAGTGVVWMSTLTGAVEEALAASEALRKLTTGLGFFAMGADGCSIRPLLAAGDRATARQRWRAVNAQMSGFGALANHEPGISALCADTAEELDLGLADGERILAQAALGDSVIGYFIDAIDACHRFGRPDRIEEFASRLEQYTAAEPFPYATFHVERGRALAAHLRGDRGPPLTAVLERLAAEARRLGFSPVVGELERVLADR